MTAAASTEARPGLRLLVCGGRDYGRIGAVFVALGAVERRRGVALLIHGACPSGADATAALWARLRGLQEMPFPADWAGQGRAAGPLRNQRMLDEGKPEACVAFPGGRGTADMVRRCEAAGVPVWRPYG